MQPSTSATIIESSNENTKEDVRKRKRQGEASRIKHREKYLRRVNKQVMEKFTNDLMARLGLLDDVDSDQFALTSDYVPESVSPKYVEIFETDSQSQSPDGADDLETPTTSVVSSEIITPSIVDIEFISEEAIELSPKIQKLSTAVSVFHSLRDGFVDQSVEIVTENAKSTYAAEFCIQSFPSRIVSTAFKYVPSPSVPHDIVAKMDFRDDDSHSSQDQYSDYQTDHDNVSLNLREVVLNFADELDISFHPTGAEAMRLRRLALQRELGPTFEEEENEVESPAQLPLSEREKHMDVYNIAIYVNGGKFVSTTRRPLIPLLIDILSLIVSTVKRIDDPGPWKIDGPFANVP